MYKIGLLYCKKGQSLEEEMYNNGEYVCVYVCVCVLYMCICNTLTMSSKHIFIIATSSAELDEFLDFVGDRVRMKGFQGYRAQLDNRSESYHHYGSHDHLMTSL